MPAELDALRLRYPAAIKTLMAHDAARFTLSVFIMGHSNVNTLAVARLINQNPDLRRSLSKLHLDLCCSPPLAQICHPRRIVLWSDGTDFCML